MTTFAADNLFRAEDRTRTRPNGDDSIKASLHVLEAMLDEAAAGRATGDQMFDSGYFDTIGAELRRLHARLRIHHAAGLNASPDNPAGPLPPELSEDQDRLRAEHPRILGQLDRLVRSVDTMADRPLEDKEVFVMRIRELIAILRRREAEEDRLLYFAIWQDTGGES